MVAAPHEMVRTSKYAKKPKENADFAKKRVKVGKKAPKPDSYTDTTLRFKKLRQVQQTISGVDAALHALQNPALTQRRDAMRQLLSLLKSDAAMIGSKGAAILAAVFKGLNEEKKEMYEISGEAFQALAQTNILVQYNQLFRLNMKLYLNNNFIMNRRNLLRWMQPAHLDQLGVEFVVDLIPSLADQETFNLAAKYVEYLLQCETGFAEMNQREDLFTIEQQFTICTAFKELSDHILSLKEPSSALYKILVLLQERFPGTIAQQQLDMLPFPQFCPDPTEQFAINVYLYLLKGVEQYELRNAFHFEKEFDLQKILGHNAPKEETRVVETVPQLLSEFDALEKKDHEPLLFLLTRGKLDARTAVQQYFPDSRHVILSKYPDVFPTQMLLDELCKAILRAQPEARDLIEMLFHRLNAAPGEFLDAQKFFSVTIKGKEVSCARLVAKRFPDDGVVDALIQRLHSLK